MTGNGPAGSAADALAAGLFRFAGEKQVFNAIRRESKADGQLAVLLAETMEYASIYVLARKRQKGCDGMGELATMKEEFRDVVDRMMRYCKEKEYISVTASFDVDSVADEIESGREAP